jgi:hypothetical protein
VGTVEVKGDGLAGATLSIDDRERGTLPLAALRVSKGSHRIRITKAGFDPILVTVEIKPQQNNVVPIDIASSRGRLTVKEQHGFALRVEIDGKDRGVTPFDEPIEPGQHRVRLVGFIKLTDLLECTVPKEGPASRPEPALDWVAMESTQETITVKPYDTTPLTLLAGDADAPLRITSTPAGATVMIDQKVVGKTPWASPLPLGEHAVRLSAEGHFPARQAVTLEKRKQPVLHFQLEHEPDTAALRRSRNIGAGLAYGVGGLGIGVFAVTGALALDKVGTLQTLCPERSCNRKDNGELEAASALGTASTIGLVVGGLGLAAGTAVLFLVQPGGQQRPAAGLPASIGVALGPGGLAALGSF